MISPVAGALFAGPGEVFRARAREQRLRRTSWAVVPKTSGMLRIVALRRICSPNLAPCAYIIEFQSPQMMPRSIIAPFGYKGIQSIITKSERALESSIELLVMLAIMRRTKTTYYFPPLRGRRLWSCFLQRSPRRRRKESARACAGARVFRTPIPPQESAANGACSSNSRGLRS